MWRLSYGREARAALAGRVVAVHYFAIAATGVAVGALVDRWPAALPALYLLIAGFGFGGALLYRALSHGGDPERALRGEAETRLERQGLLRTFAGILRADTGFRRYLTWLFVLDSGVQMMTAPVLICLADRFSLTRIEQTLLITAVPMVAVPIVMPLFAAG